MEEKTAVAALAALAQEARLRVFRALVGAGPQGMTPSALSAMLDLAEGGIAGLMAAQRSALMVDRSG